MKNTLLSLLIFLFLQGLALGQKEGIASIKKEDLKAHMEFFASDQMKGRETGTEANDIAALYIKSNIMRLGLKPGGDDYYQHMSLVSYKNNMVESFLKMRDSKGETIYSTDSIMPLMTGQRSLEEEGEIVFAGYGHADADSVYNDFRDIDPAGKIVLFMTRTPQMVKEWRGVTSIDFQEENTKIGSMLGKGARGFLYVFDPGHSIKDPFESVFYQFTQSGRVSSPEDTLRSIPFILAMIKQETANQLLKASGKTLKQYQDLISSTGKPASSEIPGITVSLKAAVERREFDGKNVIGIVEGSDPVLKNECIVYTAHFDHVGKDKDGNVYNGADDDASGSMALIEIAKAFMSLKKKPLRSVVFVWVNGEEKGLLGSGFYVNKPALPLDETLLDINLDMIGRTRTPADTGKFYGFDMNVTGPGEVMIYTKHESTELTNMVSSAAAKSGLKIKDMGDDIEAGGSDHESFWAKGVPAVMFHTGIHADVHQLTDDESKIDYDKMEQITRLVFQLGYTVANQPKRFKVDRPPNENSDPADK